MNISETNSSSVAVLYAHIKSFSTASYAINLILSLPTNVYVLWLIVTEAGGTMASEFFALNLAVSEILFCLSSVLFFVYIHIPTTAVYAFFIGLLNTGRPLFQTCVCVERYLAVVHPVVYLKFKPLRYRVGCCAVVWLMVLGSCLFCMPLILTSMYYYAFLVQDLILMFVMSFCCLSVLRALKRPGPGDGVREREGTNNLKMKAFKIIWIILLSMMVNYLPMIVIRSLYNVLDRVVFYLSLSISFSISVICGFVQPLIYLHRAGKLPCIRGL